MKASDLIRILTEEMENHHCDPEIFLPGVEMEWETIDSEICRQCDSLVDVEIASHSTKPGEVALVDVKYSDKNWGRHPEIHLLGKEDSCQN